MLQFPGPAAEIQPDSDGGTKAPVGLKLALMYTSTRCEPPVCLTGPHSRSRQLRDIAIDRDVRGQQSGNKLWPAGWGCRQTTTGQIATLKLNTQAPSLSDIHCSDLTKSAREAKQQRGDRVARLYSTGAIKQDAESGSMLQSHGRMPML
jgi:hypothetical protein